MKQRVAATSGGTEGSSAPLIKDGGLQNVWQAAGGPVLPADGATQTRWCTARDATSPVDFAARSDLTNPAGKTGPGERARPGVIQYARPDSSTARRNRV